METKPNSRLCNYVIRKRGKTCSKRQMLNLMYHNDLQDWMKGLQITDYKSLNTGRLKAEVKSLVSGEDVFTKPTGRQPPSQCIHSTAWMACFQYTYLLLYIQTIVPG